MTTGAQYISRSLFRHQIAFLTARAGRLNTPLLNEFKRQGISVETFASLNTAIMAADGASRRKGAVQFVVGETRHDVTSSKAAIEEAKHTDSPLVIIIVFSDDEEVSDLDENLLVTNERNELMNHLHQVFTTQRSIYKKPFIWCINDKVLNAEEDHNSSQEYSPIRKNEEKIEHVQLRRAASLIDDVQKVVIWAGGGALRADAGNEIAIFADQIGAPVITTNQAAGLLPARHPCLVGLSPHFKQVGQLLDDTELIIAIGTDLDDQKTQGQLLSRPNYVIAINTDTDALPSKYQPTVLLRGNAKTLTKALHSAVTHRGSSGAVRTRNEEIRRSTLADVEERFPEEMSLIGSISAAIPDHSIVLADQSLATSWLVELHEWTLPRSLAIQSCKGSRFWAPSAFVGASLASWTSRSTQPIIGITTATSFLENISALAHLSEKATPDHPMHSTLLVFDDGTDGMLSQYLKLTDTENPLASNSHIMLAKLANNIGLRADYSKDMESLSSELNIHFQTDDPTVFFINKTLSLAPSDVALWYRNIPKA